MGITPLSKSMGNQWGTARIHNHEFINIVVARTMVFRARIRALKKYPFKEMPDRAWAVCNVMFGFLVVSAFQGNAAAKPISAMVNMVSASARSKFDGIRNRKTAKGKSASKKRTSFYIDDQKSQKSQRNYKSIRILGKSVEENAGLCLLTLLRRSWRSVS